MAKQLGAFAVLAVTLPGFIQFPAAIQWLTTGLHTALRKKKKNAQGENTLFKIF